MHVAEIVLRTPLAFIKQLMFTFRHSVTSHMAGLCLTSAIMIMGDVFLFTRQAAITFNIKDVCVSLDYLRLSKVQVRRYARSEKA